MVSIKLVIKTASNNGEGSIQATPDPCSVKRLIQTSKSGCHDTWAIELQLDMINAKIRELRGEYNS